jgi:hypothetical protein
MFLYSNTATIRYIGGVEWNIETFSTYHPHAPPNFTLGERFPVGIE